MSIEVSRSKTIQRRRTVQLSYNTPRDGYGWHRRCGCRRAEGGVKGDVCSKYGWARRVLDVWI